MSDVLLLNSDYLPLKTVSWKKAMTLIFKDVVFPVSYYEDWTVSSAYEDWQVPAVIVLRQRASFEEKIKFCAENVFIRDKFICQYCGNKFKGHELELEHVIPESRGGQKCFENIVAACSDCNGRKRDRTPKEAGMKLLREPRRPSDLQYRMYQVAKAMRHPSWADYAGIYSTFLEANDI